MRAFPQNDEIIGKRFKSKQYNEFTVLSATDKKTGTNRLFEVEFDEVNGVKYKYLSTKEDILKGSMRNPFYPNVCNIGYMGNVVKKGNGLEYKRWQQMISRCYDVEHRQYRTYGGKGVTVSEEWHSFENYLSDFSKLVGYSESKLEFLDVDKDSKIKGNKIYSPETCVFITRSNNSKEMHSRVNRFSFIAISPTGQMHKSDFQKEFMESNVAKSYKMTAQGISNTLKGRQKSHRGWNFMREEYEGDLL